MKRKIFNRGSRQVFWRTLISAFFWQIIRSPRLAAEDQLAYKYENYREERGRVQVATSALLFETALTSSFSAKGEFVYDAISGATPTGGPPPPGSSEVPVVKIKDVRTAGTLELKQRIGRYSIAPQVAYSIEDDYESYGVALNQSLDFNQKNTTLNLGLGHNFDRVLPAFSLLEFTEHKDTTDILLGVTQILTPGTLLAVNFTYSYAEGYLSDPYKGVHFDAYPDPSTLFPENRPRHKNKQIALVSLTQYVEAADASIELTYRFHHDSFGIWAHTATAAWLQKLGNHVVLEPMVRYYNQTAADFYSVRFGGDPSESLEGVPEFYSSDYRLSALTTWTFGIKGTFKLNEHFSINAAFQRYEMTSNDHMTSASAYPRANTYVLGATISF